MKAALRLGLAILLTPLVFIGLSRIDSLARWAGSNAAWTTLTPLFHLFGVVGVEGEENVLLVMLLAISFVLAAAAVWTATVLLRRRKAQQGLR